MKRNLTLLVVSIVAASLAPASASPPPRGAVIHGVVGDENGRPLAGICVSAEAETTSGDGYWNGYALTNESGFYLIEDLAKGAYRVRFADCDREIYATEYFDDKPDRQSADLVLVGGDQPKRAVNAMLAVGGVIEGAVRDPGGAPAETCARLYREKDWEWVGDAWSFRGSFRFTGLNSGRYKVSFADCYRDPPIAVPYHGEAYASPPVLWQPPAPAGYLPVWYPSAPDFESATPIDLTVGETVSGIDVMVTPAAGIGGEVTGPGDSPLPNICVSAWNETAHASAQTDWEGGFQLNGLPSGAYMVSFTDCRYPGVWQAQYYDGARTAKQATLVDAVQGSVTPGIDAVMVRRPRPDAAVTSLSVKAVAIEALGAAPADSPHERVVTVEASNLGTAGTRRSEVCHAAGCEQVRLFVWATSMSNGRRMNIASDRFDLRAGERLVRSYDWHASRMIGDVTVHAQVCVHDDADHGNDRAHTRSYSVVGGTGIGLALSEDSWLNCNLYSPQPIE